MPTIQISKIQIRRGPANDLPNPSLDDGEMGFTTSDGLIPDGGNRLFVGETTPTSGKPNYNRTSFPYQNIEILTENSPLGDLLAPVISDNKKGFIKSVPLSLTGSFLNLKVLDSTNTPQDYYIDLAVSGANAIINYYVYDSDGNSIRQGILNIIWNTNMVSEPSCVDEFVTVDVTNDIQWKALLIGTIGNQHVVLQYINQTGDTPTVYFRLDRPEII